MTCGPWLSRKATGSTLCQRKYLPSCLNIWFTTSAVFEFKFAVRALMRSANSGTLRSSCICLLPTYQGEPVARSRHLDLHVCRHAEILVYCLTCTRFQLPNRILHIKTQAIESSIISYIHANIFMIITSSRVMLNSAYSPRDHNMAWC